MIQREAGCVAAMAPQMDAEYVTFFGRGVVRQRLS
jgi:hypothetical protein